MLSLTRPQARRIALAAQGFCDPSHAVPTMRTFRRTLARTGVLQIDSVSVLQRAHYMPLYSRMGPYDTALLTRASEGRDRDLVEYWAHVAAFMPVELWPQMRHRMRDMAANGRWWSGVRAQPELLESVRREVRARGPLTARDLDDAPREKTHWGWNWSATKDALEYLFAAGEVVVTGRNAAFERLYDVPERALPAAVLDHPEPTRAEASLELIRRAARSHGVATLACLRDYYRMSVADAAPAVDELVAAGELERVEAQGWSRPAFLHADAARPRRVRARALLSPFDPVVWERARTEALFDFHYRIEIYVPEAKRVYGYYVLPFLLGDRIVARVDLKADRAAGILVVRSAWREPDAPEETAVELAAELRRMAGWLGLDDIVVEARGDLMPALSSALAEISEAAPLGL